jgi:hypothetical protein
MELATFVSSQFILEPNELRRGINRIGLNLSESEFNALVQGNSVDLEGRGLSEIGSIFIMAAAVACPGIPIYCWLSDLDKKCCVYLTLTDSKPVLKIGA